jgi:metal-sulfur cluster biosynthetic enzyme
MNPPTVDPRVAAAWKALELVIDPEVGLDIVTMGLVYDVSISDDVICVTHTLTTQGCPMEAVITQGIIDAMAFVSGIRNARTRLVWDPAWHPGMMAAVDWG